MRVGFLSKYDRERISFMRQHGFGSVELLVGPDEPFLPGKDSWQGKAREVRYAYDEAGVRISCIGGFYVNHMDADREKAEQHRQHVRSCITLASQMAVPMVAGFAGRVMNQDLEASLPQFREIWGEHARFAEDHGVKIAFEHCPMGAFHSPFGGINCICTPAMWERCFNEVPSSAVGIEWDASHLICQFIDPLVNLRHWGSKVFHIHAKDTKFYREIVDRYGIYHPGAVEHCFVGLGDASWPQIVKELVRAGYRGDLNLEGWHDIVFRDHDEQRKYEDWGLLIAQRHLAPLVDGL
jgi:sugar phosphate isomerase/epimerase